MRVVQGPSRALCLSLVRFGLYRLHAPALNHVTLHDASCTGVYANLRASGIKGDLSLVVADKDAVAAGVFTKNVMCAAPVTYCKDVLAKKDTVRAVSDEMACLDTGMLKIHLVTSHSHQSVHGAV